MAATTTKPGKQGAPGIAFPPLGDVLAAVQRDWQQPKKLSTALDAWVKAQHPALDVLAATLAGGTQVGVDWGGLEALRGGRRSWRPGGGRAASGGAAVECACMPGTPWHGGTRRARPRRPTHRTAGRPPIDAHLHPLLIADQ